jgi:predicted Zn-dependent protease
MLARDHSGGAGARQHMRRGSAGRSAPSRWRFAVAVALVLGSTAPTTGCAVNPATGEQSFTPFMSQAEELRIGREQHPKVLKEFGGVYADRSLAAYVDHVGQSLVRHSELPNFRFTFTVLNTPVVNAFALPGGYVYITRGLMALASDEAELAGVLAHEIGHITARHSAQRYSQSVVAGLGLAVLGAVIGSSEVVDLASFGAQAVLQGYSRDQELEADTLGLRYVARAGYAADAVAGFLAKLNAHSALESEIRGRPGEADRFDIMATHPRTVDRVQRAQAAAGSSVGVPVRNREAYLRAIDGMLFGDDPDEGFIRGPVFSHPKLGFRFEVPTGFRLVNGSQHVTAHGPDDAVIVFDAARQRQRGSVVGYLGSIWAQNLQLSDMESLDVNGMPAATAWTRIETRRGAFDLRLVAIRWGEDSVYRFMFLTRPRSTASLSVGLRQTTYSFRALRLDEVARLRPLRIRSVTVVAGDTGEGLARRMAPEPLHERRFHVINGLEPGQQPTVGQSVKLILE